MNSEEAFAAVQLAIERARVEMPELLAQIDNAPSKKLTKQVFEQLETLFADGEGKGK